MKKINATYKLFLIIFISITISILALYIAAHCNIKTRYGRDMNTGIEQGIIYSYGLDLGKWENWLGQVDYKIIPIDSSRHEEYFYDWNYKRIKYYHNGQTKNIAYIFGADGAIGIDYYEDGTFKGESASIRCGDGWGEHGRRLFFMSKNVRPRSGPFLTCISERYFIEDKPCSKAKWEAWVNEHPEDEKYSRFIDYDQRRLYYFSAYITGAVLILLIILIKNRNSIVQWSTIIMLIGGFIYIYYILQTPL